MKKNDENSNGKAESSITYLTKFYAPSTSEEALEAYNQGVESSLKGDFKSAIKLYKKALKIDPDYVDALDNLGLAYRNLGMLRDAEECYKNSIKLFPDGLVARVNLALVYRLKKKYEKALIEYTEAKRIDPSNPEGYFGTAHMNYFLKKYKEALIDAKKALLLYQKQESPHIKDGFFLLGSIYFRSNDLENAKKYIKQALDRGATNIPLFYQAAVGLLTASNIKDETHYQAVCAEFLKLLKAKHYSEALPLSQIIVTREPENAAFLSNHAECLFETKNYFGAAKYYMRAYAFDPMLQNCAYHALLCLALINDETTFIGFFEEVFRLDSAFATSLLKLDAISKVINDNNMSLVKEQFKQYM